MLIYQFELDYGKLTIIIYSYMTKYRNRIMFEKNKKLYYLTNKKRHGGLKKFKRSL